MRHVVIAGVVALIVGTAAYAAPIAGIPPLLVLDGSLAKPQSLTPAEFKALPRTSSAWTVHGKTMTCEGPWLIDVLARAGVPVGDDLHGAALATIVIATASDGYRAAFTLGELDRKLGNAPIMIADICDGAPLPTADGPLRIVAAMDRRGARSVRGLVRLTLMQAPLSP